MEHRSSNRKQVLKPGSVLKIASLTVLAAFFPLSVPAETVIVEGEVVFRYQINSRDQELLDNFFEYENNSNSQRVIRRNSGNIIVENRAKLEPLNSRAPWPADYSGNEELQPYLESALSEPYTRIYTANGVTTQEDYLQITPLPDDEVAYLAGVMAELLNDAPPSAQHELVEQVITMVRERVEYQLNTPVTPRAVLQGGRTYCTGYANISVQLLRVAGIPARNVYCYIPPGHFWGFGGGSGGGGFHEFLEVYYEDIGWVSYDPQGSIHYVDPFHIVNYPRRGVSIRQLETNDLTRIVDIKPRPDNWDNFFQRRSGEPSATPFLNVSVTDSGGSRVTDSYNSDRWLFRETDSDRSDGVRIHGNGESVMAGSADFFFEDGLGGWIYDSYDGEQSERRSYDLSDDTRVIRLRIGSRQGTLNHFSRAGTGGSYRFRSIRSDRSGTIRIIAGDAPLIVGSSRNTDDPMYTLNFGDYPPGSALNLTDLPRYLDPEKYHVSGTLPQTAGALAARLMNSSGRYYEAGGISGDYVVSARDGEYNRLFAHGNGYAAYILLEYGGSRSMALDLFGDGGFITVSGGSSNIRYRLISMDGNRYSVLGDLRSDADGNLRLQISAALLEGGDIRLVRGQRVDNAALRLTPSMAGTTVAME